MEDVAIVECPFCLDRMLFEDRDGVVWMVCPNGCPTEMKVAAPETEETLSAIRQQAAGAA